MINCVIVGLLKCNIREDDMQEKITNEELSEILNRTIGWIENCDTKASTVLSGAGVVASILLATDYVEKILSIYKYMLENLSCFSILYLGCNFLSIGACIFGCILLVGVLIARVNLSSYLPKGVISDSLIFFSSISQNNNLETYKTKVKESSIEELNNDIISQIYVCSLICSKKFNLYKKGLVISFGGFIIFLLTIILGSIVI